MLYINLYIYIKHCEADGLVRAPRHYFEGLAQERRNSSALAMELCLSCTNPSSWSQYHIIKWIFSWYCSYHKMKYRVHHFHMYTYIKWFLAYIYIYICMNEINGLVQEGSNSIVNAVELLQYCTKPSRWVWIGSVNGRLSSQQHGII